MCTIIKVKRKIHEDPVDCLILECKKKKLDANDTLIKEILKYGGSAKSENDIPEKIEELNRKILLKTKDNLENEYKISKSKNLKESIINQIKVDHQKQRYVLVNKKRGLDTNNKNPPNVNIIDVICSDNLNEDQEEEEDDENKSNEIECLSNKKEQITCNDVPLMSEKCNVESNASQLNNIDKNKNSNSDYIYDLYYTKNNEIYLDLLYQNNYTIKFADYNQVLFSNEFNEVSHEECYEDDDEDSNDEDNWRNDYPDEDDENYTESHDNEYDTYGYDYDDDSRISRLMKKSCAIDDNFDEENSENDDFDEYYSEYQKSYSKYRTKNVKGIKEDVDSD